MKVRDIQALFFKNIGIRQTVIKNTFWLALAEGISRFLELVLVVYIIRILGVVEYGKFSFALAFVFIFVAFSDFGLSDIVTREISSDKKVEKDYPAILSLKIVLSLATLILILFSSFFITVDPSVRLIILVLGLYALINDFFFIFYAFLRARQKMEYEAGAKISRIIILVPIILFIILRAPSIKNISYGYLFASLLSLILILLFFYFKIQPLKLSFNRIIWRKFFRFSWPLGLAAIFGTVFISIDSVIMGYFGQITQTGYYNASRKIIGAIVLPSTFVFMSFYPLLSKLFKESKEKLQKVWNYYMELMIVLAVPTVVGGFILAPKIINFIFGSNFGPSILAFQILIFVAGINFLYSSYILILIISGQQKKYFWINLAGAIINVILNFILIPLYSLYGASVSEVITYIILFILGVEFSRRFTPILPFNSRLLKVLIMAVLSSAATVFFVIHPYIYALNVVYSIIIGILIYLLILLLFYRVIFGLNFLTKILWYQKN